MLKFSHFSAETASNLLCAAKSETAAHACNNRLVAIICRQLVGNWHNIVYDRLRKARLDHRITDLKRAELAEQAEALYRLFCAWEAAVQALEIKRADFVTIKEWRAAKQAETRKTELLMRHWDSDVKVWRFPTCVFG